TLGTATSEEHLKRIFRIVPSVLFCFDGDQAGRRAAWRALEATLPNLQDGRRARFLFLPEGEDPDSLVRAEGTEAFQARINQQAQSLGDYFFQQLTEEADPRSLEGKAHLATLAAPLIERIPGANLRTLMRQRLTEITGLRSEPQHSASSSDQPPPDDRYFDSLQGGDLSDDPSPPFSTDPHTGGSSGKRPWDKKGPGREAGSRKPRS